jgi:hypothetical protein
MKESPAPETNKEAGFIKIILIVLITVVILSILNIDIRGLIESESFQKNFTYLKEVIMTIWNWIVPIWTTYLKEPVIYLINFVQISIQKPV